ncbi:MAG TPA: cytochrome c biogenesis protein CcsA [Candidatus Binataceae bacterium]|nr:cytochrome c biogenesis protein CcsA [Candidatus Binataceae bacterium]
MTHRTALRAGAPALALMLVALWMVFAWVPTEADQGIVQRIFYFHVACAWVAFVAFALVAVCGIFYLWLGQAIFDQLGYAAAEGGMIFCTLVLITGSIWARPIWGVWWTWDSRLTTTLILWLLYGGYLMLRAMSDDTPQTARFAAVLGIVATVDVPVIIVSVRMWRTIHPAVLVTRSGGHGLEDPRMVITLLVAVAAFTALFIWLLMLRVATVRASARLGRLGQALAMASAAVQDLNP